jgi:phage shock protein PspC (stress-responsive transcriptional regulator)
MKKVLNINLGGLPFIIDEDAYDYMENYLNAIRKHFQFSDSRDEIMYDIEMRMSELFQEKLKSRQIITRMELDSVIQIMGKPEAFGGEPMEETSTEFRNKRANSDYKYIKTGKKLYRDEENKVVGGVCSGLATYIGVEDPIWIRLIFFLMLMAGFGFIIYLFFWIAVPKAVTASDRLAMKGEPINIDNIAKAVEEEIDALSKKINEFGEEISRKSKDKSKKQPHDKSEDLV